MTPEQEAQDRLRRAIVDDEFPDAEQVESPFAAVIPDPLAFERNAAVSAWMSQASGRNVDAGMPTWQAEKDALARGFFKMPTAKGITDSEIHGLVRQHVMTSEEAVMDGINAALAGRPLLESVSAFDAKGGASKLRAKWPEYSQEMRKYYDATEARVAPYRDLIKSSAAQLGKEMETGLPATDAFKDVADQLLEIPEADRRIVIKAMAATGGDTPDAQRSYLGKLGAAFGRMSEGLGSSVESGVSDLIYSMAASGGIEQVNQEAATALKQKGQTTRSYYQLANMVRKVADSDISPIEAEGFFAETGVGLARMGPMLFASRVPYAGVATMASFYRDDVAANLMLEYEGMSGEKADQIALVAAPGIAAIEHASNLLPFGKLPGVGSFLKSSITSIKAGIIRGGTLIAAGTGGEIAEEVFQEIAPKLVQDLFAEVDKEVPGVNWTDEKKKLEKIPAQVFGPALAVSLIGGGVVSVNDVKHGRAISSDRDTLIASGYAPSMADNIALKSKEGDWAGVDALMRSAYDRKKGGISGATEKERKAAVEAIQAKVLLQQSAIESLRNNGDLARAAKIGGQWVVTRPDGSAPVAFDNPDDANDLVFQDAKERNLRVQAVYRDIISQANRDLQEGQELAFVFSPEKMDAKYAVQIGLVSAEAVEGRKKQLAALDEGKLEDQDFTRAEKEAQAEGDTDAVYTILGMNNIENREGVSRGVIRLFQGANFTDLIEEISEVSLKRHLISGEAKRPSMLASLRQAESAIQSAEQAAGLEPTLLFRTKDDSQISDGDLIEAFSHLAKSYYINAIEDGKTSQNWRLKNRNVTRHLRALRSALANTEIFKWLKAMGEKLGTIYKRAAMVQEVQKAGGLDANLERLIRRSVGLDTQDQMEAGILQEAQGIVEEAGMSLSKVTPAQDAEYLAAVESGDMEKAQKMVDDAARAADVTYKTKVPVSRISYGELPGVGEGNKLKDGKAKPILLDRTNANDTLALADGYHRLEGMLLNGETEVTAIILNKEDSESLYNDDPDEIERIQEEHADDSADPVTRDASGNIIPLSQRFNEESDNINFSLSKGDQSLEQRLAAMFDPFQKNPEQRRKLGLIAKERVAKVATEYADIVAMAGATREKLAALDTKYSEELAASRADYQAEMKALRDERDFELEGAKQQKETKANIEKIKADYAARIASRDKAWEKEKGDLELRQSNERGAIQRGLGKLDTESLRQAIRTLGAAISIMPSKVVAKILPGGVNELFRIKTDAGRLEAIERLVVKADVELEKFLKEEISQKIEQLLERYASKVSDRGQMESKLTVDTAEIVDFASNFSKLPVDPDPKDATKQSQQGVIAELEKTIADPNGAEEMDAAIEQLGIAELFFDMQNKEASEVEAALQWLEKTVQKGRDVRKALNEARKAYLKERKDTALNDVLDGQLSSPTEAQNTTAIIESSLFTKVMSEVKGLVNSLLWTSAHQLEVVFGKDSAITKEFYGRLVTAANQSTDIKRDFEARRKEAMAVIFDTGSKVAQAGKVGKLQAAKKSGVVLEVGAKTKQETIPAEIVKRIMDGKADPKAYGLDAAQVAMLSEAWTDNEALKGNRKKQNLPYTVTVSRGRPVELTMSQGEGIQYLLWSRQKASRTQMERDGWTSESFDQLNKFLSPEAKQIAAFLIGEYQIAGRLIAPVSERLFNTPFPSIQNYSPIYRDVTNDDSMAPLDAQQMTSGIAAGFIKSRNNRANAPLKRVDAFTAYMAHIEHVSHWVSFVEVLRDMKGVVASREVQNAITTKKGKESAQLLKTRIKSIEMQGNQEAWTLHSLNSIAERLNTARAFKGLAWRISPILKQASALFNPLLGDVPAWAFMRGFAKLAAGKLDLSGMIGSDVIQRRIEGGFSAEARIAQKRLSMTGSQALAVMGKGMVGMTLMDAGLTGMGAAITFDYYRSQNLKQGMSPELAVSEASRQLEITIAETAQPTDSINRALVESTAGPWMKGLWLFASETRKMLGIELMAVRRLATGTSKNKAMDLQRIFVAHILSTAVTQTMSGVYALLMGDDDDVEREWSTEQWAAALIAGPINGLFVIGKGIQMTVNKALGLRVFQNTLPMDKVYEDVWKAGTNLDDLANGDPEEFRKELFRISAAFGTVAAMTVGPGNPITALDVLGNALKDVDDALTRDD